MGIARDGRRRRGAGVAYAIETANGIAVLQFIGQPEVLEARADELWMIALVVRFGD